MGQAQPENSIAPASLYSWSSWASPASTRWHLLSPLPGLGSPPPPPPSDLSSSVTFSVGPSLAAGSKRTSLRPGLPPRGSSLPVHLFCP